MRSIGKARGLQATADEHGTFNILALDHRQNLRAMLHPGAPTQTTFDEMLDFKRAVVSGVSSVASAVLLDPEAGVAAGLFTGTLPGHVGLIVAVEETGYKGDDHDRHSRVLEGWSVEKARRIGASAVKLLVYYHPGAVSAAAQERLVAEVAEACRRWDIPLFVEALMFSVTPGRRRIEPEQRLPTSVAIARRLGSLGADVLKVEFPLDPDSPATAGDWEAACSELTRASEVPWVLLSGSVDFDVFLEQVRVACAAGASGAMSGRSVWKEAVDLAGDDRAEFLATTARSRLELLGRTIGATARPWFSILAPPDEPKEGWHRSY